MRMECFSVGRNFSEMSELLMGFISRLPTINGSSLVVPDQHNFSSNFNLLLDHNNIIIVLVIFYTLQGVGSAAMKPLSHLMIEEHTIGQRQLLYLHL